MSAYSKNVCNTSYPKRGGGEKVMKRLFVVMMAVLFVASYSSAVMAFHDAGVAYCGGCHTMHNSQEGALIDSASATGNSYLLKKGTPSDTCLSCHAGYGQLTTDGLSLGPGGDFYWMKTDVSYVGHSGSTTTVLARKHGHNLNAPGNALSEDTTLTTAPGGTYDATYMGCNSCHDPHGNANFRLLYGIGETAANYPGGYDFTDGAPVAIGGSRKTKLADSGAEKYAQHVGYQSGMSGWCANCHPNFHSGMTSNLVHPTGQNLGTDIANNYNAYVTTGTLTGDVSASYLGLVPFEDAANTTTTSTAGPTATSKVMCLTCHRAHASPYPDAGRWDFAQTELSESHPAGEPYLAEWDGGNPLDLTHQRSLCNKCHIQD